MAQQKPQYKGLRLILGDQLNAKHSWFADDKAEYLYLIAELKQEADYTKHHIQKVCAFFKAMENFAVALDKAGFHVLHLTLDETQEYSDLTALIAHLCDKYQVSSFDYQRPDEYRLLKQMMELTLDQLQVRCYDTEHFLVPYEELDDYLTPGKHTTMEFFYRKLRRRFNVLMDDGEPLGKQWNFDSQNRNKLKQKDIDAIPQPLCFANDVSDILKRIERHNVKTIGNSEGSLLWPVNRAQAQDLLAFFCEHLLPSFGQFQDAMTCKSDDKWTLYHSRLSFALNAKMLHPKHVIDSAIAAYQDNSQIDIAQIEGFVRQILGWREYIRAVYWLNMPDYRHKNYLLAQRNLPSYFWHGKTKMRCLSEAITQSLDYAYAHHIQRLMVTGNFCLLTGIHPDQVDEWYLGIYIDAIEWVEMPNTRGMTQFADHGIVATKPYAASGNYMQKMSDYCQHCHYDVKQKSSDDACPLNSLYWHFMHRHEDKFANNHRIGMIYRNWQKQDEKTRQEVLTRAQWCLDNIEQL
ncbi:cryptochrome/photolyase family protein [Pseudoalteromonas piscicida]|uniref:Cryptochrome/photolyase family protein n=1 Tax=Pseudoalteromonas piscicida TaxID=43662 RepID=A0AAQ2ITY2_PSEO7|nr:MULTISPECIES: cryptochrome/photolyase family protein [Pseudoalteromonas]KJY92424.1 deoxyribodipyrimidine photolyase [Pseudoalteromonas piscicida]TMN38277.1 cryptochrome/photolyase family protein [Pseudoalteromonas piscicida]TMN39452.1 cryptochrome/photolyase family protein [Pseudoalteromonas piscicida]TMN50225.1 cryptochrome/photolyase family protein [Pseudoalteromonas piscicida]TMN52443.1 cryptochrome/photolyase family protein [Pseudoalteromonas piscicida]